MTDIDHAEHSLHYWKRGLKPTPDQVDALVALGWRRDVAEFHVDYFKAEKILAEARQEKAK